jgi:uncharacterized SAM-binding protein YcdF (DUF218 family)
MPQTALDNPEVLALAETVWNYHRMGHPLARVDCILVLGTYDIVVAEWGAQLFLDGWAPLLVISGGLGAITGSMWEESEAQKFARIAIAMGVPGDRILLEERSTNTGENILFTRRLLAESGIDPGSFLVVQKPYMERRAYATFRKLWPQKECLVTSPPSAFLEYLDRYSNPLLGVHRVISIMVGDLQRVKVYPEMGFQIPQEIPPDVWEAFERLVALGYDSHLVPGYCKATPTGVSDKWQF